MGDRVELKTTGGSSVLVGVVEKIDPMRTVLRTDSTVPVAVPNKAITDMIVSNESRLGRSGVVAEFKVSIKCEDQYDCTQFIHLSHFFRQVSGVQSSKTAGRIA